MLFICLPLVGAPNSEDHARYLQAFWEEEPEFHQFAPLQKNRHQIPRQKIRAYLARIDPASDVEHRAIATSAYLGRVYSGFVHAAAPQLLEMYDPLTSRFRASGYRDSPLAPEPEDDLGNQFFPGVFNISIVARAVGANDLAQQACDLRCQLEPHFAKQENQTALPPKWNVLKI